MNVLYTLIRGRNSVKNQNSLNSVLDRYLKDDTYSYAIMIDGVWGCGKTFFIKKYINESVVAKNRKCIYISLYGLNSINDLNKQIKLQYVFGEKYKKKYEITKVGTSIALDLLESKGVDRKYVDQALNLIKKNSLEGDNLVLILDDLERSTIPVVEVLGYINGLVEHQRYKVIILANENEIDCETSNLELKYLIAKDPNLIIKEKPEEINEQFQKIFNYCTTGSNVNNGSVSNSQIDDEKLRQRVKDLFTEKSKYFLIKEKVIGITYAFDLKLNNVIKEIHNDVLSSKGNKSYYRELSNIIDSSTEKISKIMITNNHKNLRTYQFYLSKIIGLFECLTNSSSNKEISMLIKDINVKFFQECLFFKASVERSDKLNLLEDYLVDYIRGLVNVDDINFVQNIWKFYDTVNSENEIDLAIRYIYNWSDWNAEEIREKIIYLTMHVKDIDPLMYKRILNSFVYLQEQNIVKKELIQEFLYQLRIIIHGRNQSKTVIQDLRHIVLENNIEMDIYENYIKILKSVNNTDISIINPFNSFFTSEKEKVHYLDDFTIHNINYLNDEIIDKMLNVIKHSTYGSELRKIFDSLYKVYLSQINEWNNNTALQENLKSLNKLKVRMKELNDSSQFDPVIQVWIRNIEQRIDRILKSLGNK